MIEPMEPTKVDLSLLVPRFPAIFPNLTNPVFKFNTLICKEALDFPGYKKLLETGSTQPSRVDLLRWEL